MTKKPDTGDIVMDAHLSQLVMPGLVPGIHVLCAVKERAAEAYWIIRFRGMTSWIWGADEVGRRSFLNPIRT